jgi:hypothetical protein
MAGDMPAAPIKEKFGGNRDCDAGHERDEPCGGAFVVAATTEPTEQRDGRRQQEACVTEKREDRQHR